MTDQLREVMTRLADTSPPVAVDPSVWDRGRRARRRDRVVARVAALSLVAVLGGLAVLVTGSAPPVQPAGTSGGALPTELWGVPDHLVELREDSGHAWTEGVGESDLAVGPGVVAFLQGTDAGGLPVVVTRDGGYHPLDLPGYVGVTFGGLGAFGDLSQTLALSPDGTHLAWVRARPATGRTDYSPVPTGIRITDLTTGETTGTDLRAWLTEGQALLPHRITWSPDGRWLAWQGRELQQYNGSGSGSGGLPGQAGRIEVATGRSTPVPDADRRDLLAVRSDGTVLFRDRRGKLGAWGPGAAGARDSIEEADALGAVSPDGSLLALGRWLPSRSVPVVDVRTGQLRERDVPSDVVDGRLTVEPVGWVDERHLVAVISSEAEPGARHLAMMTPPTVPDARATYRVLTRIGTVDPRSLSVATASVDPDRPTADLPEPEWPWSDERRALVAVLVLGGLALAAYGIVLLVRHRRL